MTLRSFGRRIENRTREYARSTGGSALTIRRIASLPYTSGASNLSPFPEIRATSDSSALLGRDAGGSDCELMEVMGARLVSKPGGIRAAPFTPQA
jgi:hypothetical protein